MPTTDYEESARDYALRAEAASSSASASKQSAQTSASDAATQAAIATDAARNAAALTAVQIQQAVDASKSAAQSAASAAAASASAASASVVEASTRVNDAEEARDDAVSARDEAVTARNDAVSAKDDALQAKTDAQAAQTGAAAAKDTAVSAAAVASAKADEAAASAASAEAVAHRPPPKCNDMGNVIGTTTVKLTWSDPDDLEEDGWVCAEWQRTVAVMKMGGHPASVDDGVIVAATSRSPETDTYPLPQGVSFGYKNAYVMDSVTVEVEDGDTACIKLFSCARTGTWNNLAANEYPSYTSYSWGQLAEYADAGTFTTHIPVGSMLDMENTDLPNAKWLVVDTDCFELQNQAIPHHVALLSYRALFTEKCDEPENQWALTADAAAVTGITYGLNINGTMTALAEGTDWNAGDTSVTRDGVTYSISDWYEKNPNGNYNYGTNFTPQTNMQQWFSSDGDANQWFTPQNLWDKVNSTLANRPGFQHGLPATFKSCLLTCKRTVYVYTSYRKRGVGESLQYNANVFALTNKEVFNTNTGNVTEGRRQLSFLAIDADHRKCYLDDGRTAVLWWLASVGAGNAGSVFCVSTAGASAGTYAYYAYGYRPACAFGKQASL